MNGNKATEPRYSNAAFQSFKFGERIRAEFNKKWSDDFLPVILTIIQFTGVRLLPLNWKLFLLVKCFYTWWKFKFSASRFPNYPWSGEHSRATPLLKQFHTEANRVYDRMRQSDETVSNLIYQKILRNKDYFGRMMKSFERVDEEGDFKRTERWKRWLASWNFQLEHTVEQSLIGMRRNENGDQNRELEDHKISSQKSTHLLSNLWEPCSSSFSDAEARLVEGGQKEKVKLVRDSNLECWTS